MDADVFIEMVALLREMDFVEVVDNDGDIIIFCPICGSIGNRHNGGCRLQAVLQKVCEVE